MGLGRSSENRVSLACCLLPTRHVLEVLSSIRRCHWNDASIRLFHLQRQQFVYKQSVYNLMGISRSQFRHFAIYQLFISQMQQVSELYLRNRGVILSNRTMSPTSLSVGSMLGPTHKTTSPSCNVQKTKLPKRSKPPATLSDSFIVLSNNQ